MGRGRQKAKNTKVARELKYYSPATDYSALEAELSTKSSEDGDLYEDKWADLYDDEDEDPSTDEDREVDLDRD